MKMFAVVLSVFLLLPVFSHQHSFMLYAQSGGTTADREAVTYNDSSYQLRSSNPQKAVELALRARSLVTTNQGEMGRGYFIEGIALANQGISVQALIKYDSALIIYRRLQNQLFIAKILNGEGVVYGNLGNYSKALQIHLEALKIRESINDSAGIPTSLNNLGAIYHQMGNPQQAIIYFRQALEQHQKRADTRSIIMTLSNIGAAYSSLQDFQNALDYHRKAMKLCEPLNDEFVLSSLYNNIGGDLVELGDFEKSTEYHKKSLALKKILGDQTGEAIVLLNIGQCLISQKKYKEAESFLKKSHQLAAQIGYTEAEKNADAFLSDLYEKQGDIKQALFYYKQFSALKDSLLGQEKATEIGKVEERYELEKAQEELQRKQQEEQRLAQEQLTRRNRIQYSGIFIFIISLFLGTFAVGKFKLPIILARVFIFFTFLLFFEFTILLVEPWIESYSNNIPLLKLAINASIALVISPLHGYLEEKMKQKLSLINRD